MPVKGLAKRGGVPASPLAIPGQVESGKRTDPVKGFSRLNHYPYFTKSFSPAATGLAVSINVPVP